jgi:hypothetical protein
MKKKHRLYLGAALAFCAIALLALLIPRLFTIEPTATSNERNDVVALYAPAPGERPVTIAPAEIESSLAKLCSGGDGDSADSTQRYDETTAQIEQYMDLIRLVKDNLVVSTEAEHLHLAALLETDKANRVDLISKAMARNPDDAYLVWDAVQICADTLDQYDCPLSVWEDRLITIDGQNSESWIQIATNRYDAGDVDEALQAMSRAATSAESRAYWTEAIEMIERGFAAGSDYSFSERAGAAFGIAASKLPDYGARVNMCKEQSARNAEWAYVCLAYGELLENQGKTDMGQSIARSVQKLALEAIESEEKLTALLDRQELYRRERSGLAGNVNSLDWRLIVSSPAIFSGYLAAVRTHGEVGARTYLRDETSRWLEQNHDLDCAARSK